MRGGRSARWIPGGWRLCPGQPLAKMSLGAKLVPTLYRLLPRTQGVLQANVTFEMYLFGGGPPIQPHCCAYPLLVWCWCGPTVPLLLNTLCPVFLLACLSPLPAGAALATRIQEPARLRVHRGIITTRMRHQVAAAVVLRTRQARTLTGLQQLAQLA